MADQAAASRTARAWTRPAVGLAVVLLGALGALAGVAARGPAPVSTPAERVHAIATGLRCPVCRDLSVADPPAPLARQMHNQIAEGLATGKSPAAISPEFVAAYGESVLLVPARRGVGLVAWVAPALRLAGGPGTAVLAVRRWRARGAAPAASSPSAPGTSGADKVLFERGLARFEEDP